jgi:Domain of unknown function (DUF6268)
VRLHSLASLGFVVGSLTNWAVAAGDLSSWSFEGTAEGAYVAPSEIKKGHESFGSINEGDTTLNVVASNQISQNTLLRFGMNWQRFSFTPDPNAPVPETLQSLNLEIGADYQLTPTVLLRVEAQPGFYTDFQDLRTEDFNMPFLVGATYFVSKDFLCVLGFSVDVNRRLPVYPATGARWRIAPKLVIDAILPDPQIDYELNRSATLHFGASLKNGSYRVDRDFGKDRGIPRLDNSILDYTEIRAAAGVSWNVTRAVSVDLESGCVPYRKVDFLRADYKVTAFNVAPFAELSFSAKF